MIDKQDRGRVRVSALRSRPDCSYMYKESCQTTITPWRGYAYPLMPTACLDVSISVFYPPPGPTSIVDRPHAQLILRSEGFTGYTYAYFLYNGDHAYALPNIPYTGINFQRCSYPGDGCEFSEDDTRLTKFSLRHSSKYIPTEPFLHRLLDNDPAKIVE